MAWLSIIARHRSAEALNLGEVRFVARFIRENETERRE